MIFKTIWGFITEQLLGMKWLNDLIGFLIQSLFSQSFLESRLGLSLQFFFYDFIKISVLLLLLIFIVSYIQSYFPPQRTKQILSRHHGIFANILGALLGTITPFCSCSSIPLFIGFTRASIPTGVTFSFLISSPLVDLGALVLLISIFGFPVAVAYVISGLILAVIGGTLIEKSGLGEEYQDFVRGEDLVSIEEQQLSKQERMHYAINQALATYKKVVLYLVIGILIGAVIHNWIPVTWVETVLGQSNPFSVVIATAIGTPMYADIFGTIPIAESLFAKGVGVGTILAFMMSVTALSIPSLVLLSKAVKPKLLALFFGIVVVGIIGIGYLFNFLQFLF
ncbi:MAG: permease [Bacilli bacterium]